jgi:glutamate-1-semialdehyde 2,1-aminomutase
LKKFENIALQRRARECIAQNALTNSKREECFVQDVYPTHIKKAYKCYLIDADDKKYIDYICGLGTNYFGYGNYHITNAVTETLKNGAVYSFASEDEVLFAEEFKGKFPFVEKIKILKEGSAGCAAAIKIARAYTGRDYVLSEGYHGWHDAFVQLTPPAHGVIRDGKVQRYDSEIDECFLKACAAVIVEPVILDASEQRRLWLQNLRRLCTKHGTLLIFDETITAMRFQQYSVAKAWNILPDIWVGGKALGGGLPISVVGGKKEVMDCDYFVSSTWAGDRTAIAAARKAFELLSVYHPDNVWANGQEFLVRFNCLSPKIQIEGYPTRGRFIPTGFVNIFYQEMAKAGVLFGPSWFYNLDLHFEMDNVIGIARSVIKKIRDGKVWMEHTPPVSPFAEKMRSA